jgi:glycosyltransferase involved in cell wall biosynthesis
MNVDDRKMPLFDAYMSPAVSVVIPVHNGARYLTEALESVRRQSFADFEIVVIDDGSTDDSARILAEFAQSDRRCRIITQENRGLVAALNRGIQEARGDLIARMDADDGAELERFARQVEHLRTNPDVAALGSSITIIDDEGRDVGLRSYQCGRANVALAIQDHCALAHPSVMMRRSAVIAAGGYREAFRHAEDYDLWLRLSERHALDNLPEPLLRYRRHGASISHTHRRTQVLATFMARLCSRARRRGEPEPVKDMGRPVDKGMLQSPAFTPEDRAMFILEAASLMLRESEHGVDDAWLMDRLEAGWGLRRHLDARRFVRRCLLPYAKLCHERGRSALARRWHGRALRLAPADALWRLFFR